MNYHLIDMKDAVQSVLDGKPVFMMTLIGKDMTLADLEKADCFVISDPESVPDPVKTDPEPVKPKTVPKPKPQPKKDPEPKSRIDHGKIVALHKAKWPACKIADEMGISQQTVYNHLRKDGLIE